MFRSHPNKLLTQHFKEVYDIGMRLLDGNYEEEYRILAYCHDFGKYTSYFQEYLITGNKNKLANHGFISALFGAYIAINTFGEDNIIPLLLYNNILHHHGSIKNFSTNLPQKPMGISEADSVFLIEKVEIVKKQIEDIKNHKIEIATEYEVSGYGDYFNEFLDESNISDVLKKLKKINYKYHEKNKRINDQRNYFKHNLLYSALIAADKLSASDTMLPTERFAQFEELLEVKGRSFKNDNSFLNNMRAEIFDNIQNTLEDNAHSTIFTITSPTGSGKTLSGFFAALKLQNILGDNRRIIYSLPFTSIINQNYDVIYNLFANINEFKGNSSHYIMKHHSMANKDYESEFYDYSALQSEMLMESWNSGVVVTTFVQLLETLISSSNRMLKKFNSIKGAIILLDEVQAIDIEYYPLVNYILKGAVEYLDCRIIMMTATKPMLLQDSVELLKSNEKYFNSFKRTKLIPKLNNITLDDFVDEFIEAMDERKSYLIVCNTIKQSLEIYHKISKTSRDVYYLSTNLLPMHRREVIEDIKAKLSRGEKPILISTQVVEAGVDLDFDEVIRDLAPLDSIIQAAGRCNRNNKRNRGDILIYNMISNNGKSFGQSVYGKSSLNITKALLEEKEEFLEEEYLELINDYFVKVNDNLSKDASNYYIDSLNNLKFSQDNVEDRYAIEKFSLIKEKGNYIDVFFILDDKAEELFYELRRIQSIKDINEKNNAFNKIKGIVRDYILSLPIKYYGKFSVEESSTMFYLPREGCEDYYDNKTGFVRDDNEEYMIF